MNREEYQIKLTDPRWLHKREKILKRDSYACHNCGKTNVTLNIHHLFYKDGVEPWDYKDDELITLCKECHETGHLKEKQDKKESIGVRDYIENNKINDAEVFSLMPEELKKMIIGLPEKMTIGGVHTKRIVARHPPEAADEP